MAINDINKRRLTKNSITGFVRYIITIPVIIAVTPFILRGLGTELYGVWAIFSVITAFADLSDLGITSGLIRFFAKYWAVNDELSINRAVSTIILVYFLIGSVVVTVVILLNQPITGRLLNIPDEYINLAILVVMGAIISFFISLVFGVFGSILQGLQRMELWNVALLTDTLMNAIGSVVVLSLGYGLRGLVFLRIFVCLCTGLLNLLFARRVMPTLKVHLAYIDWAIGREIITYSLNILVTKITIVAKDPLSKSILIWTTSLRHVAFYDLGSRIANQARGLFSAMLVPLIPAASGIHTIEGRKGIVTLFHQAERYLFFILIPVFGGLVILAKPIINVWLGSGYEIVVMTFQLLLIINLFSLIATPANAIMEGIGLARINALISIFSMILGVGLSIWLGAVFGYFGVIAGICLSALISLICTILYFYRLFEIPLFASIRSLPLQALLFYGLAMVIIRIGLIYYNHFSIISLGVFGAVYGMAIVLGTLIPGSLNINDTWLLKSLLGFQRK